MATNKMRPIHPGEILREYLAQLNMSAHALAMELRVPAPGSALCARGAVTDAALRRRVTSVQQRSSGSTCKAHTI